MSTASLAMTWLQLLALLAAEVGLIAAGVALLLRWSPSAAWRRTFCQAGVAAVLILTACELSGSARVLGSWAVSSLTWPKSDNAPQRVEVLAVAPATPVELNTAVEQESEVAAEEQTSPTVVDEASAPPLPIPPEPTLSVGPADAASPAAESASDSMGVLWLCLVWGIGAALAGARVCLAQCLFVIFQLRRSPVTEPALVNREGAAGSEQVASPHVASWPMRLATLPPGPLRAELKKSARARVPVKFPALLASNSTAVAEGKTPADGE